jgi:hypothetical protein
VSIPNKVMWILTYIISVYKQIHVSFPGKSNFLNLTRYILNNNNISTNKYITKVYFMFNLMIHIIYDRY